MSIHLKGKEFVINVRNNDEKSLKWAILSAIHSVENDDPDCVLNYERYTDELNFDENDFNNLDKFEKLNPNFSINVYHFDETTKEINTIRLTKESKTNHLQLLLLVAAEKHHFCWIKNFNQFVSQKQNELYYCDRCLNSFEMENKLKEHQPICLKLNSCRIEMPQKENNKIEFKNVSKQLKVPFIIYADIRTFINETEPTVMEMEGETKATKIHEHTEHRIGYYLKSERPDIIESRYELSPNDQKNSVDWFINELKRIMKEISPFFESTLNKSPAIEQKTLQEATNCFVCWKKLDSDCVGRYEAGQCFGAVHKDCANVNHSKRIPIIFDNLEKYHSHFLIKKLSSQFDGNVKIRARIENSIENLFMINVIDPSSKIKIQFIDSRSFMDKSLNELSSILSTDQKSNLKIECSKWYPNNKIESLEKTIPFPYEYFGSMNQLDESLWTEGKFMISADKFNRKLKNETISTVDYERVQAICKEFSIETLGDYSNLHLMINILLLADVFESFRSTCLEHYKLDPAQYITAASLSWDAMLKYTGVKLELLTDIDQLMFIQNSEETCAVQI